MNEMALRRRIAVLLVTASML
jgi:hypothetical protein